MCRRGRTLGRALVVGWLAGRRFRTRERRRRLVSAHPRGWAVGKSVCVALPVLAWRRIDRLSLGLGVRRGRRPSSELLLVAGRCRRRELPVSAVSGDRVIVVPVPIAIATAPGTAVAAVVVAVAVAVHVHIPSPIPAEVCVEPSCIVVAVVLPRSTRSRSPLPLWAAFLSPRSRRLGLPHLVAIPLAVPSAARIGVVSLVAVPIAVPPTARIGFTSLVAVPIAVPSMARIGIVRLALIARIWAIVGGTRSSIPAAR